MTKSEPHIPYSPLLKDGVKVGRQQDEERMEGKGDGECEARKGRRERQTGRWTRGRK